MGQAFCPRCHRRLLLDRAELEWVCSNCARRYPPAWIDHGTPTYIGPPVSRKREVVEHPPDPTPAPVIERCEVPGLRTARKERRIRQEALAEALGVSRVSISYWESLRYTVEMQVVTQMAEVLGVDVSRLTGKS